MSARAKAPDTPSSPNPGAFEMVRREPGAELAGVVTCIFGYRETIAGHHRQYQAASLDIPIIINFGTPFAIALGRIPRNDNQYGTFAAGLSDRPTRQPRFHLPRPGRQRVVIRHILAEGA